MKEALLNFNYICDAILMILTLNSGSTQRYANTVRPYYFETYVSYIENNINILLFYIGLIWIYAGLQGGLIVVFKKGKMCKTQLYMLFNVIFEDNFEPKFEPILWITVRYASPYDATYNLD